ncbi:MAG: (2Fe-2S)-binding protein [Bdellovibrionales bacterium]|nr:(2Fe-2S)-binding protein [Bdellovibrionales bacterium]
MPKCKINGKEVDVPQGTTIIEAFKASGQEIAHYCWHPGLSVAGVCRLCMVQIEGQPKLQIACNTEVKEGMVINNNSETVKDTVRWGLDFHLINHPLDCPICDQAGECGLQEQYMQFGKYDPEMAEHKVKKCKVVDLGPTVVLDSERCILCSRCVRFTDEVSKTHELGIFERGDRSEIGTFDGKPLNNKYSLNTVDICPVGALTSKDFRFRQRVWYLKEHNTICTGCSTGCNVKVYYNEEGCWRVKPRYNPDINGYWMCDEGRDIYKFINKKNRLQEITMTEKGVSKVFQAEELLPQLGLELKNAVQKNPESVALILTGQYSCEEYQSLLNLMVKSWGLKNVFHWVNHPESMEQFDGLLLRGDKNPNTKGLLNELDLLSLTQTWKDLEEKLHRNLIKHLIVAGPENLATFSDVKEKLKLFSSANKLIWLSAGIFEGVSSVCSQVVQIPTKTFFEKEGSYINHKGMKQRVTPGVEIVKSALSLCEFVEGLHHDNKGAHFQDMDSALVDTKLKEPLKENFFTATRGSL